MPAVILVDVWEWTPFVALIALAALQSLDREPLEAAMIDGASSWQRFRFVIYPMILPALLVALLIRLMDSFKTFDIIYVLTLGWARRFDTGAEPLHIQIRVQVLPDGLCRRPCLHHGNYRHHTGQCLHT